MNSLKGSIGLLALASFCSATLAGTATDVLLTDPLSIHLTDLDKTDGITPSYVAGGYGGADLEHLYLVRGFAPYYQTTGTNLGNVTVATSSTHLSGASTGPGSYYNVGHALSSTPVAVDDGNLPRITITPHTEVTFTMGVATRASLDEPAGPTQYQPSASATAGLLGLALTNISRATDGSGDPFDGSVYDSALISASNGVSLYTGTPKTGSWSGELTMSFKNLTDSPAVVAYIATGAVSGWDAGHVAAVPEPAAPLMFIAGLGVIGAVRARRARPGC